MNVMLGTTPVPLDPTAPAPAVPGIAMYIDPPSDFWDNNTPYVFRLAHLGVDNHAVHFHLANLQVVNRRDVTNTLLVPADNELGWKETIRSEPFTDLILAVRPKQMLLPFQIPRSNRLMDVTTPLNSTANYVQPAPVPGTPTPAGISNQMTDYGWEYVWHCHLLGHEENDMMRAIVFNPGVASTYVIPRAPTNVVAALAGNQVTVTFNAATVAAGGGAVTGYTVKSNPPGLVDNNAGSTSLSHTITLPFNNGAHYKFTVRATNTAGQGLPSNQSNTIRAPLTLGHLVGVFSNGTWYLDANGTGTWNGTPTDKTDANFGVGLPNAIPVAGDWDGTGVVRIGVFSNGTWYLDMNNNGIWDGPVTDKTYPNFGVGLPNVMPVVGDWDGTGKTKIGVFSNGTWYLDMNGNGAWGPPDVVETNFGVGLPNVMPVVGDWDNTGVVRIGVYSNGTWYLDMNGNGAWGPPDVVETNFGVGLPNVMPVVGDWDNTGAVRIGVYSNGTWYFDMNGNGAWDGPVTDKTYANFGAGLPNAKPVVGDWGLTGVTKIGVFSNGTWYLDMNNNGAWDGPVTDTTYSNFGVGLPNVKPVVGNW
jgi:hypothetical protein